MENNIDEDDPYQDVTSNAIENGMCICISLCVPFIPMTETYCIK